MTILRSVRRAKGQDIDKAVGQRASYRRGCRPTGKILTRLSAKRQDIDRLSAKGQDIDKISAKRQGIDMLSAKRQNIDTLSVKGMISANKDKDETAT
ncbi:hypothetical protein VM1G_11488 [Cytospora mali]|uniref:Uncharacterized protein n=1 Tax=Cytospora mali TaxID=578113 RepID=A0A194VUP4_CYTMA|nr:hypothetical protein VM1G_11488 [Valsa mali]